MRNFASYIILSLLVAVLATACSKDKGEPVPGNDFTSFSVPGFKIEIEKDEIEGHTDDLVPVVNLVPVFTADGKVTVGGIEQVSGVTPQDFSKPVSYTVTGSNGSSRTFKVKLTTFTGLPRIYLTTDDGQDIVSKDVYKKGTFMIEANGTEDAALPVTRFSIKGRGNSTWGMPKKPYKIKFDNAVGLFGAKPSKEWVLLANYADKTLIRNYLALSLSSEMQMAFSPMARFAEVYVNGRHDGNYLVSDQVEVSSSRVNVESLLNTDTDPGLISGGYLMEIDRTVLETHEDPYFESTLFPIVVKYPKDVSSLQLTYLRNYVTEAETVLFGPQFADPVNGFRKYFDEDSFIKWFIVNEIFKNVDASNRSSIYFYKPRNGKIFFGPVWDFDLGAGNAIHEPLCMEPAEFYVLFHKWFWQMYRDPVFKQKVKDTWKKYRTPIFHQLELIHEAGELIEKSQAVNFRLWPDFSDPNWAVVQGKTTYAAHVAWLKQFMTDRIAWLDMAFK